ncbi:LD-carboxypeptidase [bacterium]|nr:LD-carboxypeptidase [bacterium]
MTRRQLLALGLATASSVVLPKVARATTTTMPQPQSDKHISPQSLKPGDQVALIAPASPVGAAEDLTAFRSRIESLGLVPVDAPNLMRTWAYLGGTDQERLDDLHWAFKNPEIKAVFPVRGGYGCTRLLLQINYNLIRQNPKILCGYSDITALLIAINQASNLITYHGPVVASTPSEYSDANLKAFLFGTPTQYEFKNPTGEGDQYTLQAITKGIATGPLTGGNLALLSAMCGTPHQLQGAGKIVFIEDIREDPYKIDRMLTQLINSGSLRNAAGIICGQFTNCDPEEPEPNEWLVKDVLNERLGLLGIPVMTGAAIGHVRPKWTIPIGTTATLDTNSLIISISNNQNT